jgi:alkylhydroperoxidase family enzyme
VRFSQALTRQPPIVSERLYTDLAAHFDTKQIVQLTFIVGQSAIVNRIHAALLTDVDDATLEQLEGAACPIPITPHPRS